MSKDRLSNPQSVNLSDRKSLQFKFSLKKALPAIIRVAFDYKKGKIGAGTFPEIAKSNALELKDNKEQQAFNLISASLVDAVRKQIKRRIDRVVIDKTNQLVLYKNQLKLDIFEELSEVIFDINDLRHPSDMAFIHSFKGIYKRWLLASFDLSEENAIELMADLPAYFGVVLLEKYQKDKEHDYAALYAWSQDEQVKDWARQVERNKYKQSLKDKYLGAALGEENIALMDVYLEPNFGVFEKLFPKDKKQQLKSEKNLSDKEHFIPMAFEGGLHRYFLEHFIKSQSSEAINSRNEESRMLILFGQPGHGKSSFCYRCMFDLLKSETFSGTPFFIRLQEAKRDILDNPLENIYELLPSEIEPKDWLDIQNPQPKVLFLDGLDEMHMTHSLSDADVKTFIDNCKKLLKDKNLYIVITSRFNYVETGKLYNNDCLIFDLGLLTIEQQIDLVHRHEQRNPNISKHLSEKVIRQIHEKDELKHIKELLELPILLQMILISGVNVLENQSKAKIYDKLFETVLERKWDKDERLKKYRDENDFQPEDLRQYLSWLAFKIYQSKKGYINKVDIEKEDETRIFYTDFLNLENKEQDFRSILKDVLTSFYLKETKKTAVDNDYNEDAHNKYAIEFLHKSLYEFLMCEYIWKEIKNFFLEKQKNGRRYKHINTKELLTKVQDLFALTRLSDETVEYLKEIIASDIEPHDALMERMSEFLPTLLEYGFLHHYEILKGDEPPLYTAEQQAIHGFFGFVLIWGELNKHKISYDDYFKSDWNEFRQKYINNTDIPELIATYQQERGIEVPKHFYQMLKISDVRKDNIEFNQLRQWLRSYFLKKAGTHLFALKIQAIDKHQENFIRWLRVIAGERVNTPLYLAFLQLKKVDLKNWIGVCVNLLGAYLRYAYLRYAYLRHAYLGNADLGNAYLENTNLKGVRVVTLSWIEDTTLILKAGGDWIKNNFIVSQELKTFVDRYVNKYQAYEILRKENTEEE